MTAKYLYEMGFRISDKDIGSSAYPEFRPEFHFVVCLFIGGLPGVPKDKPHSFTIKLDGSDIEPQIDKGMGDQKPREIPPRHAHDLPPAKKPTGDVRGDTIQAIDKELTEDLTYMAGARRESVGPTNHMAGAPAPGNKSLNASKSQKKKSSVAGARVPNTGPIIPPGVGGIPSTGNLYEPLAGLGTNKDQSLQEGHPLERRTTSIERRRRRSLNEYVIDFSNKSCTEDGIPVIVDSSKKGVTGTEASEGSNPLHGASVPLPLRNISGVELVGGAPGGAPATSSTQITTPLIHLDENSLNLRGKNTGNERQNNIGEGELRKLNEEFLIEQSMIFKNTSLLNDCKPTREFLTMEQRRAGYCAISKLKVVKEDKNTGKEINIEVTEPKEIREEMRGFYQNIFAKQKI